jgi:hypothetical protein
VRGPSYVAATPTGLHGRRLWSWPMAAPEQQRGCRGAHEERRDKNREPSPRHQFHPGRLWMVKRRVCEPVLPRTSLALTIRS